MRAGGAGARFVVLVALAVLLVAASARAAVRYADPASSTSAGVCGAFAPCTIAFAIQGAGDGDEIVVRPGNYGSDSARMTSTVTGTAARLYIHGMAGASRPRLYFSVSRSGLNLYGPATVRDLEVDNPAGYGLNVQSVGAGPDSLVERVVVSAAGANSSACALESGMIRDSVCLNGGTAGDAVRVGPSRDATVTVRNVTALATAAGGAGVKAVAGLGKTLEVIVRNSIVRGDPDLESQSRGSSGATTIRVGYSNFATRSSATANGTVIEDPAGSDQSADPLLIDPHPSGLAIDGDYRQLPGSPTIDSGEQDPADGSFDLYGGPRTAGASTDIGAEEFDPPPPTPSAGGGGGPTRILSSSWWVTPAARAVLMVAPNVVKRGGVVTVYGSVASGCASGGRVTLYSSAFRGATQQQFAGVPAVFTAVHSDNTFSTRIKLNRTVTAGGYTVGGRCGGGRLGSARLRVARRGGSAPKQVMVESRFVRSVSKLEPRARRLFPRTFAGTWVGTGKHAGEVFIALTAGARQTAVSLRRSLPRIYRGRVHIVTVKRSLHVLERLQARMIRDRELIRRGVARHLGAFPGDAYDLDIDVQRNVPVVTVEHWSRAVVDAFQQRYGRFVVVKQGPLLEPDACTRDDCGQLLRGGRIAYGKDANGQLEKLCTTGFTVREQVRRVHQRLGILSAGHCSRLSTGLSVEKPYTDRGARLGGHLYQFGNRIADVLGGSVDAEWSTDDRPPFTAGNACIFVPIPSLDYCGVVRQVAENFDELPIGLRLCKSGAASGESCGYVLSKHDSPSYVPNATHFVLTSFCSHHGDSGGPVFLRSGRFYEAVGLDVAGLDYACGDPRERGVFTHLEFVQKALHVHVLTWDRLRQNGICKAPTDCTPTAFEP